jgi:hypothetical protein
VISTDPSDPHRRLVMWERLPPSAGHSLGRLARDGEGWLAHGVEVLLDGGDPVSCHFEGAAGRGVAYAGRLGACRLERVTGLVARVDPGRRWWVDDVERPDLRGCVDVDVAATPLTNTFPGRCRTNSPPAPR